MTSQLSQWHQILETTGAVFAVDSDELLHFGDIQAELTRAAGDSILVPLLHLAPLGAKGEDAKAFLHSQFSNDVNHLEPGYAQYSSWCSAKGRMQASFINLAMADDYHLIMAADLLPAIQKRLQMFILRSKVQLTDLSARLALVGLAGPKAGDALAAAGLSLPETDLATTCQGAATVIRLGVDRCILAVEATALPDLWRVLATRVAPAGLPAWRWLDVRDGLPWVTAATKEEFVPQMADFEKIGGVSFHKGCYPGQEVVARTQYLGKVKRHLYRLQSPLALAAGEDLHSAASPDQAAGKVVSCAPDARGGYVALAVVLSPSAEDLHQGSNDGPLLQATAVNP